VDIKSVEWGRSRTLGARVYRLIDRPVSRIELVLLMCNALQAQLR